MNVTSDAAVEPYEGWGGYGSSKAALEQLTSDPRRRAPRPADLRGRPRRHEHADAPGGVPGRGHLGPAAARGRACPGCSRSLEGELPSGRYRRERGRAGMSAALAFELPEPLEAHEPPAVRDDVRMLVAGADARDSSTPASATCRGCSSPATCWSSTRRRRSPRRSPAARGDGGALHLVDAAAGRGRRRPSAGSSSCATASRRAAAAARGERLALPGGGTASCSRRTWAARGCGSRGSTLPRAAARLPRRARRADPLPPTSPARGRSPPTRPSSPTSPAAPRCRAPAGRSRQRVLDALVRARRGRRAARAAHRRVLARARRAAVPRALPRARPRPPRRVNAPRGRPRDRRRHDRRARARDGRGADGDRRARPRAGRAS